MLTFLLLLLTLAFAGVAIALVRQSWGRPAHQVAAASSLALAPATAPVQPAAGKPLTHLQGSEPGWLKVATAEQLLDAVQAAPSMQHMLRQSRLAQSVWEQDLLPAIGRYAEFVQLMPASESHHHAHAGGLLSHTLEMLLAALTWRNGCLLPQGATAEDLDAWRDHWTYAVFFAALLHDIGKPLTDLRVTWRGQLKQDVLPWAPVAGSLVECHAAEYLVGFAPTAERDYGAHAKVGTQLLQRIAPQSARSFLACHPAALDSLVKYLNGEDRDSGLAMIIRKADQASTRKALMHGSRARFDTALRRPLIEVLMGALKSMLARGGELPLNRDGAVGWVYNGSVWFVAKRLADQVREHVRANSPEEAIPGDERNDRLFDTWQEYGALEANPATGQAIWHVQVMGKDGAGYSHSLSMLRFPLSKLWDHPDRYPPNMKGEIQVLTKRGGTEAASKAAAAPGKAEAAPAAGAEPAAQAAPVGAADAGGIGQFDTAPTVRGKPEAAPARGQPSDAPKVRAPSFMGGGTAKPPARPRGADAPAPAATSRVSTVSAADELDVDEDGAILGSLPDLDDAEEVAGAFLPETDGAASEARRRQRVERVPAAARSVAPIVMPPAAPRLPGQEDVKEPSPVAIAFMQWLQQGLSSGEIKYNVSGSPVHFVPQGMALVSPLIFRQYAKACGQSEEEDAARLGLAEQREVLKAGWHVPGLDNKNIHTFSVVKKGGARAGKLSAVVLAQPERFVLPVPPPNPALGTLVEED